MKNSLYKLVFFVVKTIFLSSVFIFPLSSVAQPISQLEKECNSNKFSSCGALGSKYILGEVVRQDKIKAVRLYQKACEGGYFAGCNDLGLST